MKKIVCIVVCVSALLVGCGSKSKSTVCTYKSDSISIKSTLKYDGDRLLTQTQVETLSLKKVGLREDEVLARIDEIQKEYTMDGVSHSSDISGDRVEITMRIDFTKADYNKLVELQLMAGSDEQGAPLKEARYKNTMSYLKSMGFTCK